MTNEERLKRAEKIAEAVNARQTAPKGRACLRCRHLKGAEPNYSFVGAKQYCRNPIVRESEGHVIGKGVHAEDKAINVDIARSGRGICGPDGLFWQPTIIAAIVDVWDNMT